MSTYFRCRTAALLFSVILAVPFAFAQEEFKGKTVVAVDYEPVKQPIDPRDLTNVQIVHVGERLDLNRVAATIDRLFASGLYDDVQADAEMDGDGVHIRFITHARSFIGHVDTQGKISDPPSRGVILSDSQMNLGTPFDPEDVEAAKTRILDVMKNNGLYEAQAGSQTVLDPETHQMTIRFLIGPGKRARYQLPMLKGEDRKLPDATIVRATGWRIPLIHRWRQVTESLTSKGTDGVTKKYAKEGRLTASVDVESMDYDSKTKRVTPTLDINAGPRIDIKAREAKVSKKKIQELVPVYQEGAVDRDLLTEGAHNIHDYFQSRGYPDVQVTFKEEPVANDHELIDYYIALGERRRLVYVGITGSDYFSYETIRERMFLEPNSLLMRYGRYSETFRKKDEEAIESLYQANGFRNVRVTSAVQTGYKGKENDLAVTFHINEGSQWRVEKLDVQGPARLDLQPILNQLYSIAGQPYADVNVSSDRNRILEYYYEHGFLQAAFAYKWVPGKEAGTVDLTYYITEGPQQFVRGVILSGLDRTKPSLVLKNITLKDGDPISMARINEISRQLTDLGIFAGVNSGLQNPNGRTLYKYVLYDFDEAARYSFDTGLGLEVGQFGHSTSNLGQAGGAKGAAPIVSFNVNRLNFLGRGQTISLQTRYSSLEQRESLNYIIPRFLGSLNRIVTFSTLYDTTQNVQTFESRTAQASVATSQRFNRASSLSVRFDYRRVSTSSINIPALLVPALLQPVRIGILSTSYIQDHRDNPADAHRGFWNTLDTGVAGGFFGSQRSFVKGLARNATYTPLGRNLTLARQTQFGVIIPFNLNGLNKFDAIPLPERFFGGGSVSMRGFGDNQAGPRDIATPFELPIPGSNQNAAGSCSANGAQACPTGFPIGGNALFFNNVELRFPLLGPNITGVFFHDMGNIYTTVSDISFRYHQPSNQNFNYAEQAAGFGIRYKTPLGPVRVDLSYTLNPTAYQGFGRSVTTQQLVLDCGPGKPPSNVCDTSLQHLSKFNFFFSIGQMF